MTPEKDMTQMTEEDRKQIGIYFRTNESVNSRTATYGRMILEALDAARAERDELLKGYRHASEKPVILQSAVEFLRSRNFKRPCDSDGFIACERCLTMLVCGDCEDAKSRAREAEGLLGEIGLNPAHYAEWMEKIDAFLRRGEGTK